MSCYCFHLKSEATFPILAFEGLGAYLVGESDACWRGILDRMNLASSFSFCYYYYLESYPKQDRKMIL